MISLLILQILRKEDRCFIQVLSQKKSAALKYNADNQ